MRALISIGLVLALMACGTSHYDGVTAVDTDSAAPAAAGGSGDDFCDGLKSAGYTSADFSFSPIPVWDAYPAVKARADALAESDLVAPDEIADAWQVRAAYLQRLSAALDVYIESGTLPITEFNQSDAEHQADVAVAQWWFDDCL